LVRRVLFLTELLPYPLVAGPKTRAYYVLRHLAAAGHHVTLLSFVRVDDKPEHVAHLESFLDAVHTVAMRRSWARNIRAALVSLVTGRPAIIVREEVGEMCLKVQELLATGQFDVIHSDQIPMAQYGLLGQTTGVRRVLDQHNATFQIIRRLAWHERSRWKRLLLQREARAFARYEVHVCQQFDHVAFVTQDDRKALLAQMGDRALAQDRTSVIPICVDTDTVKAVSPVRTPFRVTHVGTMFWPPNIEGILWFWEQVWPQVQAQMPDARLTLIGKNPPDQIQVLGDQANVDVPGFVEDLTPYLAETAAFVVPLHAAGGMRVKIVDGWCWGLPIVSTTIGAEGIKVQDGENILIADTPAEFVDAIVCVLQQRHLQKRLRIKGRKWVEEHYDWHRVYKAWDEVYACLF
jgi:glycosyltransferase involved in cell wall biosynthesis